MSLKLSCKIRIFLNPLLKLGSEVSNYTDQIITAETYEELVEKVSDVLASIKAPVDAYFNIGLRPESQTEIKSVKAFKANLRKNTLDLKNKYKEELQDILLNAQGENIDIHISQFLNSTSEKPTENRIRFLINRYKSRIKKANQEEAEILNDALRALYVTINKQHAQSKIEDEETKKYLLEIKELLGGQEMIFAFPKYVQTMYDQVDKEDNTYFIQSEVNGQVGVPIEDFFEKELTDQIVSNLKIKLQEGSINEFGVALKNPTENKHELFKVSFDGNGFVYTKVHENYPEEKLYAPKTRGYGKRNKWQVINPSEPKRILNPMHSNAEGLTDEDLDDIDIEISNKISVTGNLKLITGVGDEIATHNQERFNPYPIFIEDRKHLFTTNQPDFELINGEWVFVNKKVDSFITKGLNLKGDAILTKNGKYIGEIDTMNYYIVTPNDVKPISLEEMDEDFFHDNFAISQFYANKFKIETDFFNKYNIKELPLKVLKTIDPTAYAKVISDYLIKVKLAKKVSLLVGKDPIKQSLTEFGLELNVKSYANIQEERYNSNEFLKLSEYKGKQGKFLVLKRKGTKGQDKELYYFQEFTIVDNKLVGGRVHNINLNVASNLNLVRSSSDHLYDYKGLSELIVDGNSVTEVLHNLKPYEGSSENLAMILTFEKDGKTLTSFFPLKGNGTEYTSPQTDNKEAEEKVSSYSSSQISIGNFSPLVVKYFPNIFQIDISQNTIEEFKNDPINAKNINKIKAAIHYKSSKELFGKLKFLLNKEKLDTIVDEINSENPTAPFSILLTEVNNLLQQKKEEEAKRKIDQFYSRFTNNLNTKNITLLENVSKQDIENGEWIDKVTTNVDKNNPVNKIIEYTYNEPTPVSSIIVEKVNEETTSVPIEISSTDVIEEYDEDLNFQLNDQLYIGDRLFKESDKQEAERILGDIGFRSVEEHLKLFGGLEKRVVGAAINRLIYLSNQATLGTLYHESFHIAFNTLFTKEEQELALRESKKKYSYTREEVLNYANSINYVGTYEELEERFLHEKLSDGFAQWKLDRNNSIWRKYLGDTIVDIFEYLYDLLTKNKINQIYKLLNNGKIRDRKLNVNNDTYYAIKGQNNKVITSRIQEVIIKTLFAKALGKIGFEGKTINFIEEFEKSNKQRKRALFDALIKTFANNRFLHEKVEREIPESVRLITTFLGGIGTRGQDTISYDDGIPDVEINRVTFFSMFEKLINQHLKLWELAKEEKESTDDKINDPESIQYEEEVNEDLEDIEELEDVEGRKFSQSPFMVNPTNVNPELQGFLETLFISVPGSTLGIAPIKTGTKLIKDSEGIEKIEDVYHDLDQFIFINSSKIIGKLQRDFSILPVDRSSYEAKVKIFEEHLELNKTFDIEYQILSKHYWDNLEKNTYLKRKLIEKIFLNHTQFMKVTELKTIKTLDDVYMTSSGLDSEELNEQARYIIGSEVKLKNLRFVFVNNEFYFNSKGKWYKDFTVGKSLPVESPNIKEYLTKNKDGKEEYDLKVIWDLHKQKLQSKLYKDNIIERAKIFMSIYSLMGFNINWSYGILLAKDSSSFIKTQELIDIKIKKGEITQTEIDKFVVPLFYGGIKDHTVIKDVNGKSRYSYSTDNVTEFHKTDFETRIEEGRWLPEIEVQIVDGITGKARNGFENLSSEQLIKYYYAAWKQGFIGLGQLEGNATNFFIKLESKAWRQISSIKGTSFKEWKPFLQHQFNDNILGIQKNIRELKRKEKELNEKLSTITSREEAIKIVEDNEVGWEGVDKPSFNLISPTTDHAVFTVTLNDNSYKGKGFEIFFSAFKSISFGQSDKISFTKYIESLDLDNLSEENQLELDKVLQSYYDNLVKETDNQITKINSSENKEEHLLIDRNKLLQFNLSYPFASHIAYKKTYGNNYFQSFKNDNTDWVKRAKALGIFGEKIKSHKIVIFKDPKEVIIKVKEPFIRDGILYSPHGKNDYFTIESKEAIELGWMTEKGESTSNHWEVAEKEPTDGQSFSTLIHRLDYIDSISRLSYRSLIYYSYVISNGNWIYKQINNKWELVDASFLSHKEKIKLRDEAAKLGYINGVYKSAGGFTVEDKFMYVKHSEYSPMISDYMISTNEELTKDLYKQILESLIDTETLTLKERNEETLIELYTQTYDNSKAIKGQEFLFDKMKVLDTNQIATVVFASGSKASTKISTNDKLQPIIIPFGGIKNQTEISNYHGHITDSSQMQVYAIMNQNPEAETVFRGKVYKVREVLNLYNKAIESYVKLQDASNSQVLFEKDILDSVLYADIIEDFITTKRDSELLKEFIQTDGIIRYDHPFLQSIFVDHLKKTLSDSFAFKVPGEGFILLSSKSGSIQEDEVGNIIPIHNRKDLPIRDLNSYVEVFDGTTWVKSEEELPKGQVRQVDELIIAPTDEWHFKYIKMKEGLLKDGSSPQVIKEQLDFYFPPELFYVAYTRIPCENKRSMGICKIVDFLNPLSGTVCITSTQMMDRTGHDHDADKLWVKTPNVIEIEEEGITRWILANKDNSPYDKLEVLQNSSANNYIQRLINSKPEVLKLEEEHEKAKDRLYEFEQVEEFDYSSFGIKNYRDFLKYLYNLRKTNKKDWNKLLGKKEKEYYFIWQGLKKEVIYTKKKLNDKKGYLLKTYLDRIPDNLISEKAIQNAYLDTQISIISHRDIIESGLQKEATDLSPFEIAGAGYRKLNNTVTSFLGTPTFNIDKHLEIQQNQAGIGISAAAVKTMVVAASQSKLVESELSIKELGNSLNSFVDEMNPEKREQATKRIKDYEEKLNKAIKERHNIDWEISEKFKTQMSAIFISANTDAPKAGFITDINLTSITTSYASIASGIGYPPSHVIAIMTHPVIREFTSNPNLKEVKSNIKKYLNDVENQWKRENKRQINPGNKTFYELKIDDIVQPPINGKLLVSDNIYSNYRILKHFMEIMDMQELFSEINPVVGLNKRGISYDNFLRTLDIMSENIMLNDNKQIPPTVILRKNKKDTKMIKDLDKFELYKGQFNLVKGFILNRAKDTVLGDMFIRDIVSKFGFKLTPSSHNKIKSLENSTKLKLQFNSFWGDSVLDQIQNTVLAILEAKRETGYEFLTKIDTKNVRFYPLRGETTKADVMNTTLQFYNEDESFSVKGKNQDGKQIELFSFTGKQLIEQLFILDSVLNGYQKEHWVHSEVLSELENKFNLRNNELNLSDYLVNQEGTIIKDSRAFGTFVLNEPSLKELEGDQIITIDDYLFNAFSGKQNVYPDLIKLGNEHYRFVESIDVSKTNNPQYKVTYVKYKDWFNDRSKKYIEPSVVYLGNLIISEESLVGRPYGDILGQEIYFDEPIIINDKPRFVYQSFQSKMVDFYDTKGEENINDFIHLLDNPLSYLQFKDLQTDSNGWSTLTQEINTPNEKGESNDYQIISQLRTFNDYEEYRDKVREFVQLGRNNLLNIQEGSYSEIVEENIELQSKIESDLLNEQVDTLQQMEGGSSTEIDC